MKKHSAPMLLCVLFMVNCGFCNEDKLDTLSFSRPDLSLCLNGNWQISKQVESLVWPIPAELTWKSCILPQNLYYIPGEFDEKWDVNNPGKVIWPAEKAWFKRTFSIPKNWSGKRILFRCEGVCYDAKVYVNDKPVGEHRNLLPFQFDITPYIKSDSNNLIFIGYQSFEIAKDEYGNMSDPGGKYADRIKGVYGDSFLEAVGPVYFKSLNPISDLDNHKLNVRCELINHENVAPLQITATIYDINGIELASQEVTVKPASDSNMIVVSLPADKLDQWSFEQPTLYNVVLELRANGILYDSVKQRVGYRTFVAKNGGLYLNDKQVHLRATSHLVHRAAQHYSSEYIRLYYRSLKALNLNCVRLHGLPFPAVWLDVADEEGMMIIAEGMFVGDASKKTGKTTFYKHEENWPRFEKYFQEWVERDRHHPSIVMWSAYNEPQNNFWFAKTYDIIRKTDGSGRPAYCEGLYNPQTNTEADVINIHYPACPLAFPFWPDDFYYLDYSDKTVQLHNRWRTWPIYKRFMESPDKTSEDLFYCDAAGRHELLRSLSQQPRSERWTLAGVKKPLSLGEQNATWFYSCNNLSRFLGASAYRGVYDAENGKLWQALGYFEQQEIDAVRYEGADHFTAPWHPVYFSFTTLFDRNGNYIYKEDYANAGAATPGYHPYRWNAGYSTVNPGWSKDTPEWVLTAAGERMAPAYKTCRLIVKPESTQYYSSSELKRSYAVINDSLSIRDFVLLTSFGVKQVSRESLRLIPGEIKYLTLNLPLNDIEANTYTLSIHLSDSKNVDLDSYSEQIRVSLLPSAGNNINEMSIYDPAGNTSQILVKQLNCKILTKSDFSDLNDTKLFIVGENAITAKASIDTAVNSVLSRGGTVVLFAQDNFGDLEKTLGSISVKNLPNAKCFIRDAFHPIVQGLNDNDLMLWGDDHIVTLNALYFAKYGNSKVIIDQGSNEGLICPVVMESYVNGGRIVFVNVLCISKYAQVPAAASLVQNVISYINTPLSSFTKIEVESRIMQQVLEAAGAGIGNDTSKKIVDANYIVSDEVKLQIKNGLVLWINKPSLQQLSSLESLCGKVSLCRTQINHSQLEIVDSEPLNSGISGWELFMDSNVPLAGNVINPQTSSSSWRPVFVEPSYTPQAKIFGGIRPDEAPSIPYRIFTIPRKKITQPGYAFACARIGKGIVILDMIDWQTILNKQQTNVLIAKLLTNLGVFVDSNLNNKGSSGKQAVFAQFKNAVYCVDCGSKTGAQVQQKFITDNGREVFKILNVAYTDQYDNNWLVDQAWTSDADYGVIGGTCLERKNMFLTNSTETKPFETERYGVMEYRFKVEPGKYTVTLLLSENYFVKANMRKFNVLIQNLPFFSDVDVAAQVGPNSVLTLQKEVIVNNGMITIKFERSIQEPFVNAIVISK